MKRATAALIPLIVIALIPALSAGQGRMTSSAPPKGKILRWVVLVKAHDPGREDAALREVAAWPDADVQAVALAIRSLVDFLDRRPSGTTTIDGQRYTAAQVRQILGVTADPTGPNGILHLGAKFHADLAGLLPNDWRSGSSEAAVVVEDGRRVGSTPNTIHWAVGRTLLDGVLPSPAVDAEALAWYRDASAQIQHLGSMSEAVRHLERADRLFPKDPVLLRDTAYLHEHFASSGTQAAVESVLQSTGESLAVGSRRVELVQTERWFRAALAASDPEDVTDRLRLGRVLEELGRPEEAAQELRPVLARTIAPEEAYLARLFLGRAEELLGHLDRAREEFQRASDLFPRAQSPHLALGRIARESGDRASLLRSLQALAELPIGEDARKDPWWSYYNVH